MTVDLPWREFVPVVRADVDASAPPLDPAKIEQLGLVLSRFEFNHLPNSNYHAGDFELQVRPFPGSTSQSLKCSMVRTCSMSVTGDAGLTEWVYASLANPR